jgi:hypothetical protein
MIKEKIGGLLHCYTSCHPRMQNAYVSTCSWFFKRHSKCIARARIVLFQAFWKKPTGVNIFLGTYHRIIRVEFFKAHIPLRVDYRWNECSCINRYERIHSAFIRYQEWFIVRASCQSFEFCRICNYKGGNYICFGTIIQYKGNNMRLCYISGINPCYNFPIIDFLIMSAD